MKRAACLLGRCELACQRGFSTAPEAAIFPPPSLEQPEASSSLQEQINPLPSRSAASFWSDYPLKDLENSSAELELARRHNSSFPYAKNQVIVGQVVKISKDHVTVFTGHRALHVFSKKELHLSQLVKSTDFGKREGPRDFRVGDVMHFVLSELQTPFGDMTLRVNKVAERNRHKAVWREIVEACRTQTVIKGRILNKTTGGYSVGVAGFTGYLSLKSTGILTASKIGVLQDFLVERVSPRDMQFALQDYSIIRERQARFAEFRERQSSKIASLQQRLKRMDAELKQEAAEQESDDTDFSDVDLGLTKKHNYVLMDMIAIFRAELRLKHSDTEVVRMDLTALDRLYRTLATSQGTYTTGRVIRQIQDLEGTPAHDLMKATLAKIEEWRISMPDANWDAI